MSIVEKQGTQPNFRDFAYRVARNLDTQQDYHPLFDLAHYNTDNPSFSESVSNLVNELLAIAEFRMGINKQEGLSLRVAAEKARHILLGED